MKGLLVLARKAFRSLALSRLVLTAPGLDRGVQPYVGTSGSTVILDVLGGKAVERIMSANEPVKGAAFKPSSGLELFNMLYDKSEPV